MSLRQASLTHWQRAQMLEPSVRAASLVDSTSLPLGPRQVGNKSALTDIEKPMAVAVQLDFRGATLEQYDEINERLGLLPGGPASPHEFFHWVMKTVDGFRV